MFLKVLKRIISVTALVIVLSVIAIYFAPSSIFKSVINQFSGDAGMMVSELNGAKLGLSGFSASSVQVESGGSRIELIEVELKFNLVELLNRKLTALHIESVAFVQDEASIGLSETSIDQDGESNLVPSLKNLLLEFPIQTLIIEQFSVDTLAYSIEGRLTADDNPLKAQLIASSGGTSASLSLESHTEEKQLFDLEFDVFEGANSLSSTSGSIEIQDEVIESHLISNIDALEKIIQLTQSTSTANDFVRGSDLELRTSFQIRDGNSGLIIEALDINLNSTEQQLLLSPSKDLDSEIIVHLPISLSSAAVDRNKATLMEISEITGSLSGSTDSTTFAGEFTLSTEAVNCEHFLHCNLLANFQSSMNLSEPVSLSNTTVSIASLFILNWDSPSLLLTSNDSSLSLTTEQDQLGKLSMETTAFTWEVSNNGSETTDATAAFTAIATDIDMETMTPESLEIEANINLKEELITVNLHALVSDKFPLNANLEYRLSNSRIDAAITVPSFEFTESDSLQTLLGISDQGINIVGGNISSEIFLLFQLGETGTIQSSGDFELQISDLSGVFEDSAFIGFSSDITGRSSGFPHIESVSPLTASISLYDPGIPFTDISWNYGFDSFSESLEITDFTASLLKGQVAIPKASFQLDKPSNSVPIILTDIDLSAITALADYPDLEVDGAVSGVLPVNITGNSLSIDEGLVSALNPGGSIRYRPQSAGVTVNPSIKLVNDALSNYLFDTLDTEVIYDDNGDLTLKVELRGANPDMNNGQQINLNVNISDNIPTLLRSLQASRKVTDLLESQINARQ